MAHIDLPEGYFGMSALLAYKPETGEAIEALGGVILAGPSALSPGERELIGTCVARLAGCRFAEVVHRAAAARLLGVSEQAVEMMLEHADSPQMNARMGALLGLASRVAEGGLAVTDETIATARDAGADDEMIHDAVLVAAAFCMFTRYVDGLAAPVPEDETIVQAIGLRIAENGYGSAPYKA